MDSQIRILFHFWLIILIYCFILADAQNNFLVPFCSPRGNYTQDSPFRRTLDDAMSVLTRTNNGYGFFNYSSGQQDSDSANAVALCRGDTLPDTCWRCVDDATRRLRQDCPDQKEAMGWYDLCYLRYSNRSLLHTVETGDWFGRCNANRVSAGEVQQFNSTMISLLSTMQGDAAGGDTLRKFASGSLNTTGSGSARTIYGMAQCTPDLSVDQCTQCLEAARGVRSCDGTLGGIIYQYNCFVRFETAPFSNQTWYPSPPSPPPPSGKTNIALIVGPTVGAVAVIAIFSFLVYRSLRRRKHKEEDLLPVWETTSSVEGSRHQMDGGDDTDEMNYFNLSTIQSATNNFSPANKLGEGGFGPVYKGKLQDGKEIAVKRLSRNSGQGLEEFKTEVRLIVKLQHKNLVRLLGCCIKGDEKLLVYEYMVNTSLDAFLFDPFKRKELHWPMRSNIATGIAKGLRYLHEDSRLKIVHRDMKASNVLLDEEMNPKISDFGTARIFGGKQMEANTNRVVGTYGYMAPEYAMEGLFSTKSDVYSFGVSLLEIISGKKNSGFYHEDKARSHLSYAWQLWKEGQGEQFIDKNLIDDSPVEEALRWINIALLCVQEEPTVRPTMSSVVSMLEGQWTNLPQPLEPPFSVARFALSDIVSTTGSQTLSLISEQSSNSTTLR